MNPHFHSTWLTQAQLRLWLIRRSQTAAPWEYGRAKSDIRHYLRQGSRDLKRRGKTNREGANNRRWRAFEATRPRVVFSTLAFDLVA